MPRHHLAVLGLLAGLCGPAWGQSCVDPADPEQRRWFQDEPCVPPMVDMPLPPRPTIRVLIDDTPSWERPGWPATDGSRVYRGHHGHPHAGLAVRVSPNGARRSGRRD